MNGMLRVPRSRGALSGVLLILLGVWGGLVPFVGPSFHYAYTPDRNWAYTSGRLWLEILPGIAAVLGGLILLASSNRPMAMFGGWLAALSGAWFAVGNVLAPAWHGGSVTAGTPVGGTLTRAVEQVGFFTGLGVVIMLFAALAIGRLSVVSVRDARLADRAASSEPVPGDTAVSEPVTTGEPVTAGQPVTTGSPVATSTASDPAETSDTATTSRFTFRRRAADGATTEPAGPVTEPKAPGADLGSASADPGAERVDSTISAP
jgi:hypothetical protein